RFQLRHWRFVANRHRARNWKAWPTSLREKVDRRLRPYFLLPHHVRKNLPRRPDAVFSPEATHRHDDDAGEHENEKEATQHFNPPRARWGCASRRFPQADRAFLFR